MTERKIVVPGETIIQGEEFLPGDGTRREKEDIVASKYGLADISDKLVRVIPLSGVYSPRRGNSVIGQIIDIKFNGWLVDFNGPTTGFLPVSEYPRYIEQDELQDALNFGDLILAKVNNIKASSVDLSIRLRGFGKLDEGIIMKVNPNKVPRVIGKEGSMVSLIKELTGCNITVGQNGLVWIKGQSIDAELKARKIIEYICENSFIDGLTEKVKSFAETLK